MDTDTLVDKCRAMNKQGQSRDEVVEFLRASGLTITESIKIMKQAFAMPLGEAKEIVSRSPVWQGVVQAAEPLHEDLAREFSPGKRREPTKTKAPTQ